MTSLVYWYLTFLIGTLNKQLFCELIAVVVSILNSFVQFWCLNLDFYFCVNDIRCKQFTIVLGEVNGCPWLTGFYWLSEVNLICVCVFFSWALCCWPAWLPRCHRGGSDVAGAHCHRGGSLPAGPQKEDRWLPVSVREAGLRSIRGHSSYKPKSVRLWSFSGAKGHFHWSQTWHLSVLLCLGLPNLLLLTVFQEWDVPLE